MAKRSTTTSEPAPTASPDATPEPVASSTDAGGSTHRVTIAGAHGTVTFTRPGVESLDFTAEDGIISTTKERAAWLLRYAGAKPVPEKE